MTFTGGQTLVDPHAKGIDRLDTGRVDGRRAQGFDTAKLVDPSVAGAVAVGHQRSRADLAADRIRTTATASLPAKPTTAATMTQPRFEVGCGSGRRWIDSQPASVPDAAIIRTMKTPARSSARPPSADRRAAPQRGMSWITARVDKPGTLHPDCDERAGMVKGCGW